MRKTILLIILSALLFAGCYPSSQDQRNVRDNPTIAKADYSIAIVERKITENTALVGYPATKGEFGQAEYKKLFYVKDEILRNYADDDEITGYRVEKIFNKTYVFIYPSGLTKTLSCGQLIKK